MQIKLLKRRAVALLTAAGMANGGFFIPHRYARHVTPPDRYPEIEALLSGFEPEFAAVLQAIDSYPEIVDRFDHARPPVPRWQQDWFPGLDGASAYAMVRERRPRRILEIGSGHSTRFLHQAIRDAGLDTELTCIDPAPRADLQDLAIRWISSTLQDSSRESWPTLEAGDILSIDSSHLALPGSDVDLLMSGLLPALPAGILVHIHDVFLPDGYPGSWRWRQYNEQMVVAAWIAAGGLRPVFASHYVRTRMAAALSDGAAGRIPVTPSAPESSFWAVKVAPATITQN